MNQQQNFSHVSNGSASMVDVSNKEYTERTATACAVVDVGSVIFSKLQENKGINNKGPVLDTAIIAGTMAAKNTANLIPLCHPLSLSLIKFAIDQTAPSFIEIICTVKNTGPTGVEMEALTGVSVAALTVYDMCKSLSHGIKILDIKLVKKTGGKCDFRSSSN